MFYIYSVFYNNMEIFNVWMYFVGLLVMMLWLYQIYVIFGFLDFYIWLLFVGIFFFLVIYLVSSVVYMFLYKLKEVNCCMFMIDFVCIGLFGFGIIFSYYYYFVFLYVLKIFLFWQILYVGIFLLVFCCMCGVVLKVVVNEFYFKYWGFLIVIGVGLLYFLFIVFIVNWMLNLEIMVGIYYYGNQMFYMVVMGFFFMIRIFECFFLGMFDFFGNSYQVFYLLMIQVFESYVNGVIWDMLFC